MVIKSNSLTNWLWEMICLKFDRMSILDWEIWSLITEYCFAPKLNWEIKYTKVPTLLFSRGISTKASWIFLRYSFGCFEAYYVFKEVLKIRYPLAGLKVIRFVLLFMEAKSGHFHMLFLSELGKNWRKRKLIKLISHHVLVSSIFILDESYLRNFLEHSIEVIRVGSFVKIENWLRKLLDILLNMCPSFQ